eukprot:scaffold6002_cov110-Isochrysis_galbana.AAC.2
MSARRPGVPTMRSSLPPSIRISRSCEGSQTRQAGSQTRSSLHHSSHRVGSCPALTAASAAPA